VSLKRRSHVSAQFQSRYGNLANHRPYRDTATPCTGHGCRFGGINLLASLRKGRPRLANRFSIAESGLKHEIIWETVGITPDCLVQSLDVDAIKLREIRIQHELVPTDEDEKVQLFKISRMKKRRTLVARSLMNFLALRQTAVHLRKEPVQGGNLANDLYMRRSLKLERKLIHAPFNFGTAVLCRES